MVIQGADEVALQLGAEADVVYVSVTIWLGGTVAAEVE
jgi:hypothetical protein